VGLERGPLSLVSTIEELLGRKSSGSGLENRDYGREGFATLTTRHPSIRKTLALTSPTSGDSSVGIVRSRTETTEFVSIMRQLRYQLFVSMYRNVFLWSCSYAHLFPYLFRHFLFVRSSPASSSFCNTIVITTKCWERWQQRLYPG
jgi:hypothetical protein